MYLEAAIKFWEDDITEDGKDVRRKQDIHVLCKCISYTDCESMATEYGLELTSESFDVGPITELKIDDHYPEEDHESYPWFKCNCVYSVINDRGKTKEYKRSILVQSKNSAEASEKSTEIMKKWCDSKNVRTAKVSETKITEILLSE